MGLGKTVQCASMIGARRPSSAAAARRGAARLGPAPVRAAAEPLPWHASQQQHSTHPTPPPLAGYLSEYQQVAGPFLVVVPLSTVPNWIRCVRPALQGGRPPARLPACLCGCGGDARGCTSITVCVAQQLPGMPSSLRRHPPAPLRCSEFRKWIPSVNTIVYVGDAQSREVRRRWEHHHRDLPQGW